MVELTSVHCTSIIDNKTWPLLHLHYRQQDRDNPNLPKMTKEPNLSWNNTEFQQPIFPELLNGCSTDFGKRGAM